MAPSSFSELFHNILLDKIHDKKHWAKELAQVLNLSEDAIYKKARFETSYSLNEFFLLVEKYNIDYRHLFDFKKEEFIRFSTPFLNNRIKSPIDYLKTLDDNLNQLQKTNNPKILYTTRELPIFYYLLNHDFLAFKLFVFSKSVWEIPAFVENTYSKELFDPEIFVLADQIWAKYSSFYSEEYWTLNVMDSTIQQLLFFKNCGQIQMDDLKLIFNSIINVLDICSNMASKGSKSMQKQNFQLYENKILHTSNQIMVNTEEKDFMFITFDNPNFIYTEDVELMKYSKDWYDKIKRNSYSLGEGTGHQRFQFFETVKKKLNEVLL